MAKVRRTYVTKSGNIKVYEYESYKRTASPIIVSKRKKRNSGVLNKKNYELALAELQNQGASLASINDFKREVKRRVENNERMRISWLERETDNAYERMFINAGYSAEEAAEEIGVTREVLLDSRNWNKDVFSYKDNSWIFRMDYNRSVFKKL